MVTLTSKSEEESTARGQRPAAFTLRSIRPEDIDPATVCGLRSWASTIGACLPDFSEQQLFELEAAFRLYLISSLKNEVRGEQLLIADVGGEIAGFCGYQLSESYLSDLWVHPDWQGKGVASTLIDAVRGALKAEGINILNLEVWEQNQRAISFYLKQGFVEIERSVKYDPVLKLDLLKIWMQQRL